MTTFAVDTTNFCRNYLRHLQSIDIVTFPYELKVKAHTGELCYYCREDCCPACCTGRTYEFVDDRYVIIPNHFFVPGSMGTISGKLNDIFCMRKGSVYDMLDDCSKVVLLKVALENKWLPLEYFLTMRDHHLLQQKIIKNQNLEAVMDHITGFGEYLSQLANDGKEYILRVLRECLQAIMASAIKTLAGLLKDAFYKAAIDKLKEVLRTSQAKVHLFITTLLRMVLGYKMHQIILEIVFASSDDLVNLVPTILAFVSSLPKMVGDTPVVAPIEGVAVNQGFIDDITTPVLSVLCMVLYSGASSRPLDLSRAININRLIGGLVPKNVSDYMSYLPLIGDLVKSSGLQDAIEGAPSTWMIVSHNLRPPENLPVRELNELMNHWVVCCEERNNPACKDAFKYMKVNYAGYLKMPEVLKKATCRPRPNPFCMCLQGGTSVGKSNQADKLGLFALFCLTLYDSDYSYLAEAVQKDMKASEEDREIRIEDYVYTFTGVATHWDGYMGQPIIILSDFLSAAEKGVKVNAENLLRLKDTAPYLLPMASLPDKGRFAEPRVLIVTTNIGIAAWRTKLATNSNNPEAYLSRIDAYFEVEPISKTEDGRLLPIPDTDQQCLYKLCRPGAKWDYSLKSPPLGWQYVLLTLRNGIREVYQKKEAKVLHETREMMEILLENSDYDFADIPSRGVYEKQEATNQMFGVGNLFSGGFGPPLYDPVSLGMIPINPPPKLSDVKVSVPEEYWLAKKGKSFICGIRRWFGFDDKHDFHDYYRVFDEDSDFETKALPCAIGMGRACGCSDPFRCPVVALKLVAKGLWAGPQFSGRGVRFKRAKRKAATGPLFGLAMGLAILGYKYYREKTQKTITDMDSVKVLNIGKRVYHRVPVDGPLGRTYVYAEKGSETLIEANEQKKRELQDVVNMYIPQRVKDKLNKIENNMIGVNFGDEVFQQGFAVSNSRFLVLGHYLSQPENLPDMSVKVGGKVVKIASTNCVSKYYRNTDLLVVSIVQGTRLPCSNVIDYFAKELPKQSVAVFRLRSPIVGAATYNQNVVVSNVKRNGLGVVEMVNCEGMCGLPYMFSIDTDQVIAGIHSAGGGLSSYFIPITKDMVSDCSNQGISMPTPEIIGEVSTDFVGDLDGFVSCGKTRFRSNLPDENAHVAIPQLHENKSELWQKKYGLCKLAKFVTEGEEVSPARVRLVKLNTGLEFKLKHEPKPVPTVVLNAVVEAIKRFPIVNKYKPDYNELIKDNPDIGWVGMDPSKSAGPMLNTLKRDLLDEDLLLENWVLELLSTLEKSIVENRVYPCIVRGYTLKDEKLPLEKVETGMSRLFAPDDAIFYLLCKKYFFPLVCFINMYGPDIGIMTGLTPEQMGSWFEKIFLDTGGKAVDADVKSMECGHSDQSILFLMNIMLRCGFICNASPKHKVHPKLPLLSDDALVCWVLLNITLHGYCVIGDQTFVFKGGALGSGSLLTFILNCFMLLAITGTNFWLSNQFSLFKQALMDASPKWMLFGDDLAARMPVEKLREAYRWYGFDCTGADKGELRLRSVKKITFCGRSYTYHPETGPTMKLELDRIVKGVQFTKKSKFLEIYPNQVYSFLMELSRHEQEVWDRILEVYHINGIYLKDYISGRNKYLQMIADKTSLYHEVLNWTATVSNSAEPIFKD